MIPENEYKKIVKKHSKPSPKAMDFVLSFIIGGLICLFGEFLFELLKSADISQKTANSAVPSIIIFITAVLTGLGIFDKIAKHAGAGTLVPITGFANAVCSPAVEFKNEGYIMGVGTNVFKIAGPVILYGISASIIYGFLYYIYTLI